MKQKEKNQAYLSIWCHEVKSSHMKSESFCLCKLAKMQVPTLMRFSLAIFVAFLMICSLQENKRGIKNTELGCGHKP